MFFSSSKICFFCNIPQALFHLKFFMTDSQPRTFFEHGSFFQISIFPWIFWHFSPLVEHNLGIASGLYLSKSCRNVQSAEEAYFRQSFTDFFSVFEFNIYLGILAQTVNVFWYALPCLNIRGIIKTSSFLSLFEQYFCLELHWCLPYHHFHSADREVFASESATAKPPPPAVVTVLEWDLERIQSFRRFGGKNQQAEWRYDFDFVFQQLVFRLCATVGLFQVGVITAGWTLLVVLPHFSHLPYTCRLLVCISNKWWVPEATSGSALHPLWLLWRYDETIHRTADERQSGTEWNEFLLSHEEIDFERELSQVKAFTKVNFRMFLFLDFGVRLLMLKSKCQSNFLANFSTIVTYGRLTSFPRWSFFGALEFYFRTRHGAV